MERSVLQAKQDAQEQRQHKDWLSFRGPLIAIDEHAMDSKTVEEVTTNKLAWQVSGLINDRQGLKAMFMGLVCEYLHSLVYFLVFLNIYF